MAGIVTYEPDTANGRAFSMWSEGGIQFRSNLLFEEGSEIPLHAHSYDHVAMTLNGWFYVTEIIPKRQPNWFERFCDKWLGIEPKIAPAEIREYQMASKDFESTKTDIAFNPVGYKVLIPAWHRHKFHLIEKHSRPGEVLCMWGDK